MTTPDEPLARGWKLHQAGHLGAAEERYRFALMEAPDDPDALCFLGMVCHDTHRFDEALAAYERALALRPAFPIALNNRGNTLRALGRLPESISSLEATLALAPGFTQAEFNLSLSLLQAGRWDGGFRHYETRWKYLGLKEPAFRQPRWDGAPLKGRTLLLQAEQGLGDTLQFLRFARIPKEDGGRVLLVVHEPLIRLLGNCPYIDALIAPGQRLPQFDVHAPLMSVPYLLSLHPEHFGNEAYLSADSEAVGVWQKELAPLKGMKVGLAWQGSSVNKYSVALAELAPLARTKDIHFISLQKGFGTEQLAPLNNRFNILDLGERLDPDGAFVDTAAIMMNLDLVITVDTSIAHLAGALGVPVWVALTYSADWRWMNGRSDSPWYPSARLFRQHQPGDWSSVIEEMTEALLKRSAAS